MVNVVSVNNAPQRVALVISAAVYFLSFMVLLPMLLLIRTDLQALAS